MKRSKAPAAVGKDAEMHLRIMVEDAVHAGKSEREIEELLRQAEEEGRKALENLHLRIMVEDIVHSGKSEREIEELLRQAEEEDRKALENWHLPRAA